MVGTCEVDQRDTHRLIPAQFADGGISVLGRLTKDPEILDGIFELDNATNDRLLAESSLLPHIDARELVFGIPQYRIINAAFCHSTDQGTRFSPPGRGVWYAGFEPETSIAEVIFHKQLWLAETKWNEEEVCEYVDYLADFRAQFHDLRDTTEHLDCLLPGTDYKRSQAMATQLFSSGSGGIVYPSIRRRGGNCIACFRPALVTAVRKGSTRTFAFSPSGPARQL